MPAVLLSPNEVLVIVLVAVVLVSIAFLTRRR